MYYYKNKMFSKVIYMMDTVKIDDKLLKQLEKLKRDERAKKKRAKKDKL